VRETFGKYGELAEVNILKKPNGQMVGCAFIQYKKINHAAKAIMEANAKPFLGRPVAVDWAVPKEVFKGKFLEVNIWKLWYR
jgi:nucleolar protein 4